jgi:hypothetical protein
MRVPISAEVATEAIFASDRTCCVCGERGKAVQIHHIDEDSGNSGIENLAVLCLECHNQTQISGGFGRKLNAGLVIKYRDEWLKRVIDRRERADQIVIGKIAGAGPAHPLPAGTERMEFSTVHLEAVVAFVEQLPATKAELLRIAHTKWDTGVTSQMVQGSYEYIDALQGILSRLAAFYAQGSFGEDPRRLFSEIVASRFRWHRVHSEPYGPGTGGTIVNVLCCGNVAADVEAMIEDVVRSLVGLGDAFEFQLWVQRWREAK